MFQKAINVLFLGLILALAVGLVFSGCKRVKSFGRKVAGTRAAEDDDEPQAPPEAKQDDVVIDGKKYVRSKNPYHLILPGEPEYFYTEKGTEFVGITERMKRRLRKKWELESKTKKGKGVPEDQVKEMVRKEVDRILKEQGLKALYPRERGKPSPVVGRYVAVLPNPETTSSLRGDNRILAATLTERLSRQKDLKVAGPSKVKSSLSAAKVTGSVKERRNIQALGNTMGAHALILTDVVPSSKGNTGFLVMEIYDTFLGTKSDSIASPQEGEPSPEDIRRFAQESALKISGALVSVDWFGRVEFTKEGKVYLSLGQNAGLKVGDRLKVVTPGKEVINPNTRARIGFTADETQGDLKVTELLGDTGAVAQVVSGGPFKTNDKVKAAR